MTGCSKWIKLLVAAACEVIWAVAMNYSEGFSKVVPSIVTAVFYILSAVFLSFALKELPMGTAYATWTGIGIVGTSLLGVLLFNETLSLTQVFFIILILVGVVGLNLAK